MLSLLISVRITRFRTLVNKIIIIIFLSVSSWTRSSSPSRSAFRTTLPFWPVPWSFLRESRFPEIRNSISSPAPTPTPSGGPSTCSGSRTFPRLRRWPSKISLPECDVTLNNHRSKGTRCLGFWMSIFYWKKMTVSSISLIIISVYIIELEP